jgi:hypothetical protein
MLQRGRKKKRKAEAEPPPTFDLKDKDVIEFAVMAGNSEVDFWGMRWGRPGNMRTRMRFRFETSGNKMVGDPVAGSQAETLAGVLEMVEGFSKGYQSHGLDGLAAPLIFRGGTVEEFFEWTKGKMLMKDGSDPATPWQPAVDYSAAHSSK